MTIKNILSMEALYEIEKPHFSSKVNHKSYTFDCFAQQLQNQIFEQINCQSMHHFAQCSHNSYDLIHKLDSFWLNTRLFIVEKETKNNLKALKRFLSQAKHYNKTVDISISIYKSSKLKKIFRYSNQIEKLTLRKFYSVNSNVLDKILSKLEFLPNLEALSFDDVHLKSNPVNQIISSKAAKNLNKLELISSNLNNQDLKCLSQSKTLTQLKELKIIHSMINDIGLSALFNSDIFKGLTALDLTNIDLTYESIKMLCDSVDSKNLKSLSLKLNNINDSDLSFFTKSRNFYNLSRLDLSSNLISDNGAKKLSKANNFKNLKFLILDNNNITSKGTLKLKNSRYLNDDLELSIEENNPNDRHMKIIDKMCNPPWSKPRAINVKPIVEETPPPLY